MASSILGKDRLRKRLAELPQQITAEMKQALVDAANGITGEMKALIDNDPKLQEATGWAFGPAKSLPSGALHSGQEASGSSAGDEFIVTIYSGSWEAFWARWREFGTKPHSLAFGADRSRGKLQDRRPHHPGAHASPYFYPVWRARKKEVLKKIGKAVNAAIKKVASAP